VTVSKPALRNRAVIDKLELAVPQFTDFKPAILQVMREIDWERGSSRVRRSPHYAGILDLHPFGTDAFLHAYNKHRTPRDHKLELLDTGKKTYSELAQQIESVFDVNPDGLRVMRIDLCADVYGTHVSWFQPRARIKYKRFAREIGELKYEQMGERSIQTLVAGKRPNVFRFYDKTAECMVDFKKRSRKVSKDAEPLDFQTEYGFSPETVLTRVERQIGGGKIPSQLSTFGTVVREAPEFNPFAPIEIVGSSSHSTPGFEECEWIEWVVGTRLNELRQEWGMQQLRIVMNRRTKGNSARLLERYSRFFPDDDEIQMTTERLQAIYRDSVVKQLSA
jgi:hypothetical protein